MIFFVSSLLLASERFRVEKLIHFRCEILMLSRDLHRNPFAKSVFFLLYDLFFGLFFAIGDCLLLLSHRR